MRHPIPRDHWSHICSPTSWGRCLSCPIPRGHLSHWPQLIPTWACPMHALERARPNPYPYLYPQPTSPEWPTMTVQKNCQVLPWKSHVHHLLWPIFLLWYLILVPLVLRCSTDRTLQIFWTAWCPRWYRNGCWIPGPSEALDRYSQLCVDYYLLEWKALSALVVLWVFYRKHIKSLLRGKDWTAITYDIIAQGLSEWWHGAAHELPRISGSA